MTECIRLNAEAKYRAVAMGVKVVMIENLIKKYWDTD